MPPCVTSRAKLFADCLQYRPIKTEAGATKLQEDLDALQNWESTWQMSFNPDKCEVLRITNKHNKIMANYYIHGQQLQIVDNAKYLGLSSALDALYIIEVGLSMWIPHSRGGRTNVL
jgi:hypothetical protein